MIGMARLLARWVCACLALGLADTAGADRMDEAFLNGLQGKWEMAGSVRGKTVQYVVDGKRVLQGGFVRLHMTDLADPPQYEAVVYLGFDARQGDYIAHWLDRFGAGGARVVATGRRDGNRLVVRFPYAEGAFRNTGSRETDRDAWTLLIEGQEPDGRGSTFANYRLTRPH